MPRPAGTRNHDFIEKRAALLDVLTEYALTSDLRRPSLRQFALAAAASEPTLRHYFTDRQGLVIAILENIGGRGQPIWDLVSIPSADPVSALAEYFRVSEAGMRHGGFIRAHAFGLIEGMGDETVGAAYLSCVLEPALQAIVAKLSGTPGLPDTQEALNAAALAVLSPLLVLSLHQDVLGGSRSTPRDTVSLVTHLQDWLGVAFTAGR